MSRCADPPCKTRWSTARVARFGFLVGLGLDARTVGEDPAVSASAGNVRRQAKRFGLALRTSGRPKLPYAVVARLDSAATRRGLARDDLIHHLLLNAGSDDDLIDNILDDRG